MSDEERLGAFIEEAARSLGFLCDQYGFGEPSTEIDRRSFTVTVTFAKGDVAVEAIHDLREGDVELKVARLEGGRKVEGYHVDRRGQRCRASLVEILTKRGIRNFGLKQFDESETPDRRFERLLSAYARLLQEHLTDVLAGSAETLARL